MRKRGLRHEKVVDFGSNIGPIKEAFEAKISEAYTIAVKQDRYAALDALHAEAVAQFSRYLAEEPRRQSPSDYGC